MPDEFTPRSRACSRHANKHDALTLALSYSPWKPSKSLFSISIFQSSVHTVSCLTLLSLDASHRRLIHILEMLLVDEIQK